MIGGIWESLTITRFRLNIGHFSEKKGFPDIFSVFAAPLDFSSIQVAVRQVRAIGIAPNKFNQLVLDRRQNPAYNEPARSEVRFFCSLRMRFRCQ